MGAEKKVRENDRVVKGRNQTKTREGGKEKIDRSERPGSFPQTTQRAWATKTTEKRQSTSILRTGGESNAEDGRVGGREAKTKGKKRKKQRKTGGNKIRATKKKREC